MDATCFPFALWKLSGMLRFFAICDQTSQGLFANCKATVCFATWCLPCLEEHAIDQAATTWSLILVQTVSFWIVQKVSGRRVIWVNPNHWRLEEAREYCKVAARNGQQYAITRVDVTVDLVGKTPIKSISLVA